MKITVTAPEGEKAQVRVQTRVDRSDGNGGMLTTWEDVSVSGFATETREFDVHPGQRVVVEDGKAKS